MPASKRYRNWLNTTFATTAIDGVKSISMDHGITDLRDAADNDLGPTHAVVIMVDPTFTITTVNAMVLSASAAGLKGVFTTTFLDSYNGVTTGGGAVTFTTNSLSYIGGKSVEGQFNTLGTQTLTVKTTWADGVTNPVTITSV